MLNLNSIKIKEKKILIRVDFNVPVKDGKIIDKTRIYNATATINKILESSGKVIIATHFGRPSGKITDALSVKFLQKELSEILKCKIYFSNSAIGEERNKKIENLKSGEILLLENLRFHPGEENNDSDFAKKLSENIDIYINDAFSVSHRAHASVDSITNLLPSFPGLSLEKEIKSLNKVFDKPEKPVLAIISGSKISTKLGLINNLIKKVDTLILCGGIAHTFRASQGFNMQESLVERSMIETAKNILLEHHQKIMLPTDGYAAISINDTNIRIFNTTKLETNFEFLDTGPDSIKKICNIIKSHKTLVWNGPLGVFEHPPFDKSTTIISQYVSKLSKEKKLYSVAGGGETIAALKQASSEDGFNYLSTAGGAFLELLEGKKLPGIQALEDI
jgi:phosphoglycerate kinase